MTVNNWIKNVSGNNYSTSIVEYNKEFQRGKIYKFYYSPKYKYEWYDKSPLVLSLGTEVYNNEKFDVGINLNLLPDKVKLSFIDQIKKYFNNTLKTQMSGNNANKAILQIPLDIYWDKLGGLKSKYNLPFVFRRYYKSRRKNTHVISYELWNSVINNPNIYTIKGSNIQAIYNLYYTELKRKKKK